MRSYIVILPTSLVSMKIEGTAIPDVFVLNPDIFSDERGYFFESYNARQFSELTGITANFVQDNHSFSLRNVLRGLHYQIRHPQGKLVRAVVGEIFNVAVDIRRSSKTFGQWIGVTISAENKRQLWVPEGFAHGFLVKSSKAEVLYKTTDYWFPEFERCIAWNDSDINIAWPPLAEPTLSAKDRAGKSLFTADVFD